MIKLQQSQEREEKLLKIDSSTNTRIGVTSLNMDYCEDCLKDVSKTFDI